MPATELYQVDYFAIIVLIVSVLTLVFLIIAAIYYMDLINLKPPTKGESTFLFWTSIVLGIIFLALAIFSLYRIFTYKSIVYEEEKVLTQKAQPKTTTVVVSKPATPPPQTVVTTTQTIPTTQTVPTVKISNVPPSSVVSTQPSNLSQSYSDVPITQSQRNALNQELISLGAV